MKYTNADSSSLSRLVHSVRQVPLDVVIAVGFVVVADFVLLSLPVGGTPLQALLGLPLLLFVPGYGLVSALFLGHRADGEWRAVDRRRIRSSITVGERLVLSVGASLALLLPLALVLSLTGLGFDSGTVVGTVSAVSIVSLLVGTVRRWQLPESERFQLPVQRWVADLYAATIANDSRVDAALNTTLVLAVVLAATGVTYALVAPPRGQAHTNFSLLTEDDSGDLVTSGYPVELTVGESSPPLFISVQNYEGHEVTYTVVAELQRVRTADGSVTILERQSIARMQSTVGNGETWRERHTLTPELRGSNLRVTYYLYQGAAPDEPDAASADRLLFTWVNVTER